MTRFSINAISLINYRQHQIRRSLGWVSPMSLCGGGGLRNRNIGSPQFNSNEEKTKKRPLCFSNDDMLGFILMAFESISMQFFSFLKVIT